MKFETKREQLYGGPLQRGKRFHYVVYLAGERVAAAETKESAEKQAAEMLLGAYLQQTSSVYASMCSDGAILATREHAPGEVTYAFHRSADGRASGWSSGKMTIDGKRVSVAEYHTYVLGKYNEAMTPKIA